MISERLSEEEIINKIKKLSHSELVQLWRFEPVGSYLFDSNKPYYEHIKTRLFSFFGGIHPEVSKDVGWDHPKQSRPKEGHSLMRGDKLNHKIISGTITYIKKLEDEVCSVRRGKKP